MGEGELRPRGRTLALSQSHPDKAGAGHSCPDFHHGAPGRLTGMKNLAMGPAYGSSLNFRLADLFPAGLWLHIGASFRATAAPVTASPHQLLSLSPVSLNVPDSSCASELGQTNPDPGKSKNQ